MLWNLFRAVQAPPIGELMRRTHSRWLTGALMTGRAYPRIPIRPVSTGGFARLNARTGARRWADAWWAVALNRVEADED